MPSTRHAAVGENPSSEEDSLNDMTPLARNNTSNHIDNPYDKQPSYRDVLLSKVTDDSNRLGINTFQLTHLLNREDRNNKVSSEPQCTDEQSATSEKTAPQSNAGDFKFSRMRLQFTLEDTSPDTYMEDMATHLNRILEIINLNTPGVRLAPWHKTDKIKTEELLTSVNDDPLDAVKYLYGFKAGMTKQKVQYLRIHLAFPPCYEAEDIVKKNKSSIMLIPGKQTLIIANSQCVHPVTIGWFLRSTPMMADFNDLSRVLKACWAVKGDFGLYWATVRDGKPDDATQATRAIHIEVEEGEAARIIKWAEKTYGRASPNFLDYPLGINMMCVLPYNKVQGAAKSMVAKLAAYQNTNDKMITSASWYGEMALDRSIHKDKFESLRQWLMSLKSIHQKTNSKGVTFQDALFTSIHRSPDGREVTFYFYKANEVEATNVVTGLPLFIRDELQLEPGCFFHKSDYSAIMEGTWNSATREYKNKGVMNQEQYLQELDEFFSVNRNFLPEMIVLGNTEPKEHQAKTLALASGTDDVSILSQLTDKTLKAVTTTMDSGRSLKDDSSIESGQTSKSKTQAAVREALKEVSLEHNRAMEEQQMKFQKEMEALRKSMERNYTLRNTHPDEPAVSLTETGQGTDINDSDIPQESTMEVDSSDDDIAMLVAQQSGLRTGAPKAGKSPWPKRPKRSGSRNLRSRGDSINHPDMNDE